jgi:hypothetical protein
MSAALTKAIAESATTIKCGDYSLTMHIQTYALAIK